MNNWNLIQHQQKEICSKLKIDWTPVNINSLIAINDSLFSTLNPINGLRHPKHGTIDGWYLWRGGDIPQNDIEFFKPMHLLHLIEQYSSALKYLGLPPGWRFQIDDRGYEDIWFDKSLLDI